MTKDDRGDARSGADGEHDPSRPLGGEPAPDPGSRLGGLLDGLPESGRGAQARAPRAAAGAPTNPFRSRGPAARPAAPDPVLPEPTPPEPAAPPTPEAPPAPAPQSSAPQSSAPQSSAPPAPAPPAADERPAPPGPPPTPRAASPYGALPLGARPAPTAPPASPAAPPSPPAAPVAAAPPVAARPPTGPPARPNVIPLRAERAPAPARTGISGISGLLGVLGIPGRDGPPTTRPPGTDAAPDPDGEDPHGTAEPTTHHADADRNPATTEPEQSMHAHEAAAPPPGPQPSGPTRPAPHPTAQPAPGQDAAPAPSGWSGHAYDDAERAAVYRAIRERRDVRAGFRPDPVPHAVLTRVLEAAHQAPSVGYSQPWDFVVVEDPDLRARVHALAVARGEDYAHALPGARARAQSGLKAEAVLEAPLNIAVTVDPTRGGVHAPGRHAKPVSASYAAALAVENLWIAARAEGLGVGWVGLVDERDLARALELPPHLDVVAYLCVGLVEDFPTEPEPGLSGWAKARPLSWAVHHDRYGRRGLPGQEPTTLLEETITAIGALNTRAVEEARDRQNRMTKPQGSLGVLEDVSVQLAGLAQECPPPVPEPAAVVVFAGDHGVHAQGVTAWPQEVTAQMVHNFLEGGAVVNAFAQQVGAEVTVVDVGVVGDLPHAAGLLSRKVARGTADFTQGPAMTREQTLQALESGIEIARDLVSAGHRCLVTGDMGIANTTPAAALVCAFTGADPALATGRGTGVDDATYEHKVDVVRRALAANPVDPADPIGTLAALGGLEHAALTGFVLGAAALRVPVVLDGVIAGSAALAAAAMSPEALSACFAGHRSSEPGHALALDHLGLRPLLDLEMRLGEGSGALLALPLLQGAARALRDVATFDDAGVSNAQP